jgi:hypothetical protein
LCVGRVTVDRVWIGECVFTSRSLAAASNSEESSASRVQVLFSQPPMDNSQFPQSQVRTIIFGTLNPIFCCNSQSSYHLFSVFFDCRFSTDSQLLFTQLAWAPRCIASGGTQQKHLSQQYFHCWVLSRKRVYRAKQWTAPLPQLFQLSGVMSQYILSRVGCITRQITSRRIGYSEFFSAYFVFSIFFGYVVFGDFPFGV